MPLVSHKVVVHCRLMDPGTDLGFGGRQWRQNEYESGMHTSCGIFFGCVGPFFGSTSTISRFCERFRVGRYILVSFFLLFCYSRRPPCPAIYKIGGTRAPRALWIRRHWGRYSLVYAWLDSPLVDVGLVVERSRVRVSPTALSSTSLCKSLTHTCLCDQAV